MEAELIPARGCEIHVGRRKEESPPDKHVDRKNDGFTKIYSNYSSSLPENEQKG